jgi:N-acetylneuraminate epimerase
MSRLPIKFFIITMFFTVASYAQKRQGLSMKWKIADQLPVTKGQAKALGFAGSVAGVHANRLIVAGGANFPDKMPWEGGKKKYYGDLYLYLIKGNKLIQDKREFKLPFSIGYAAVCSTPQGIVYAGGENENGISDKTVLLQWNEAAENINIKNLPNLPVAVTNAAATVNGDIVYIAGGETATGVSDQFYSLDLNNTTTGWKKLAPLSKPVSHSILLLQSDGGHESVYLIGGRKKNTNGISDLYSSVFEFDLNRNEWKEKASLPYALSAGTGIAVYENEILIFGGDKGKTFHKTEELLAAISAEKDEMKKQELVRQKNELQLSHPGFGNEVLLYNTIKDEWKLIGKIPFVTPVTTTAVKWNNSVFIPGGETKAGIRTPQILIGKISFRKK